MTALLEVKDLKKYFRTPRGMLHAVDGVSFAIEEGKTLGIVGESGCGKSTLGRLVVKLHEPTGGQILFDGRDVTSLQKAEQREFHKNVQMIFQDPFSSLDPRKTVSEAIAEPLHNYCPELGTAEINRRVSGLMDTVEKAAEICVKVRSMGGKKQTITKENFLDLAKEFNIDLNTDLLD